MPDRHDAPEPPAEQPADVSAEDRAAARSLAMDGIRAYRQGDFRSALHAFRQADARLSVPTIRLYIARCLLELGRAGEAQVVLQELAQTYLEPDAPQAFRSAKREAETLLKQQP